MSSLLAKHAAPLALLALVAASTAYVVGHLTVTNDVTSLLPPGDDPETARAVRAIAASEVSRTLIYVLGGADGSGADEDRSHVDDVARRWVALLRGSPHVTWARSGLDERGEAAFHDLYFPRRWMLSGDLRSRLTDIALRDAARTLRRELAAPAGILIRSIARLDPLLLFPSLIRGTGRAEDRNDAPIADGDLLHTRDGGVVVLLGTRASAFDTDGQDRAITSIDAALRGARGGAAIRVERTGLAFFVRASARSARDDVARIGTFSTIGIALLFLVMFRGLRYPLLGMVPLAAGTVVAMASSLLVFGELHGITLAFGSSLVGVAIDYAEHYFYHHTLAPDPAGPAASLARLWPGLVVGAITTVAGLAGLAWSEFPGAREIAFFSIVGVLVSLLATRWLLPPLMPRAPRPVRLQRRLADLAQRLYGTLARRRMVGAILVAVCVATVVVGLPRMRFVDDPAALATVDERLSREDAAVRARVAMGDVGRYVVVTGRDDEEALERNDALALRLAAARDAGLLGDFQSLHTLLPSRAVQDEARRSAGDPALLAARLDAMFAAEGFVPGAFASATDDLRTPPAPLTMRDLTHSALADLVRSRHVALGRDAQGHSRVALLVPLRGVRDAAALGARLRGLAGVRLLDQHAFLTAAYTRFRTRTLELVFASLLAVYLIVLVRYRALGPSFAAFVPGVLAGVVTLATLALCGVALNLLHVVGLLLVLSMGVDYGVFVVESRDDERDLGATLVSITVAMSTTVLSFGLLAMSSSPALRALGLTASLGTFLATLLAPIGLLFMSGVTPLGRK